MLNMEYHCCCKKKKKTYIFLEKKNLKTVKVSFIHYRGLTSEFHYCEKDVSYQLPFLALYHSYRRKGIIMISDKLFDFSVLFLINIFTRYKSQVRGMCTDINIEACGMYSLY